MSQNHRVKQCIQNAVVWIVGMRRFVRNLTTSGLVASLILLVVSKAGAAQITLTNTANNSPINSTINTNAFNSVNGLTNTITWTNTTTGWTNYFASPAGGAPYFSTALTGAVVMSMGCLSVEVMQPPTQERLSGQILL